MFDTEKNASMTKYVIERYGYIFNISDTIIVLFCFVLFKYTAGSLLGRVPRVPGTRNIMSSYEMAPVNFYEIPGQQLPGTRKI